ncbi:MAG: TolC family protein [Gammaproteobacteria bacterium]|nr:TolC family protein [Gammaproteobacteria bacterium]
MSKVFLVALSLCLSLSSYANQSEMDFIIDSVKKHPQVVEKSHLISSQKLQIMVLEADDNPKVSFSTKGNLPISSKLNINQYRVNDNDKTYLDGVITAKKVLYDFGQSDANINAQQKRQKAAQLEYEKTFEQVLYRLFDLSIDNQRLNVIDISLRQSSTQIAKSLKQLKLQFSAGVGMISEVREVQLLQLDLDTELHALKTKRAEIYKSFKQEFGLTDKQAKKVFVVVQKLSKKITNANTDLLSVLSTNLNPEVKTQRSEQIIGLEKKAIYNQIKAIKAADKPQVEAVVTGMIYDVTRGLDEYNIYGGLNIGLPLFDGGLSDAKVASAKHNIRIQEDRFRSIQIDKQLKFDELIKQVLNLKTKNKASLLKQKNLSEKLDNINIRLQAVSGSIVEKIRTQIELDKLERDIKNYHYVLMQINLDYLRLNELLLGRLNITPLVNTEGML